MVHVAAGGEQRLPAAMPEAAGRTASRPVLRRFSRDRAAVAGAVVLALLVLFALAAPLLAALTGHGVGDQSHLYEMTTEAGIPKGPDVGRRFLLGADHFGRDVLVRTAYGARVSLIVGLAATGLALLVGVPLGLVAGWYGGLVDGLVSRTVDVLLSIPVLLLAPALVAVLRPGVMTVIAVIVVVSWTYVTRIVRGQVLSLRAEPFIEAQRSLGAGDLRIMTVGILPNLVATILACATVLIPTNILAEAYLSFLGLGIPDSTATWGRMIADATGYYRIAWWTLAVPGAALFATTLAFNLVGDGLRDALDPASSQLFEKLTERGGR